MLKHRLLPTTESDRKNILQHCGVRSIEDLLQGIPKNIRYKKDVSNTSFYKESVLIKKADTNIFGE